MPARREVPRAPEVSGRRPVAGVMGAGDGASGADIRLAERLGELLAAAGFVVLTGGRDVGVMAAATRGAKKVPKSLTVGVLPGNGGPVAQGLDVVIFTGLGLARNAVNILERRRRRGRDRRPGHGLRGRDRHPGEKASRSPGPAAEGRGVLQDAGPRSSRRRDARGGRQGHPRKDVALGAPPYFVVAGTCV